MPMMPQSRSARPVPARAWPALLLIVAGYACGPSTGGVATEIPLVTVEIEGTIARGADLSGVAALDGRLFVASDEGARLQILEPGPAPGTYRVREEPLALLPGEVEIDLEGLAVEEGILYALGSHSLVRPRMRADRDVAENKRRLRRIAAEPARDRLFRIHLQAHGPDSSPTVESINLRPILEADVILAPFARIPGKENGVDIEAVAADGERLYLGFRSPVLRGGLVPVMVLPFDAPERYELRFVDLGGRGIRGMSRIDGGFLLLAGFERGPDTRELYSWDGTDGVPGRDAGSRAPQALGTIEASSAGRAEGIAVIESTDAYFDVIVVLDGVDRGAIRRGRVPRR